MFEKIRKSETRSSRAGRQVGLTLVSLAVMSLGFRATAEEGYVLDGFGGVHSMGGAALLTPPTPYFGFDVAKAMRLTTDGQGYYVLDAFGGMHTGGSATPISPGPPYFGFDIARDFEITRAPRSFFAPQARAKFNDSSESLFRNVFNDAGSTTLETVQSLFPVRCLVREFQVQLNRTLTGAESVTVALYDDGVPVISCTVSSGSSTCSSGSTPLIAAGSLVAAKVDITNPDVTTNGDLFTNYAFTCN
jgi:hypothetical protein